MSDFITVAQLNAWLDLPGGATDALCATLISAASQYIRSYCNRDFNSTSYSEIYEGMGRDRLFLGNFPIVSVTSIAWLGQTALTAANQVDPTQFADGFYFTKREVILTQRVFPSKTPIAISYTAGYATIPNDIVQACTEIAGEAFKRRNRIGESTQTLSGQQVVSFIKSAMNETVASMLAQYRNVVPA
jgi:hypothetical protein